MAVDATQAYNELRLRKWEVLAYTLRKMPSKPRISIKIDIHFQERQPLSDAAEGSILGVLAGGVFKGITMNVCFTYTERTLHIVFSSD
jgi:hypothetical protein